MVALVFKLFSSLFMETLKIFFFLINLRFCFKLPRKWLYFSYSKNKKVSEYEPWYSHKSYDAVKILFHSRENKSSS